MAIDLTQDEEYRVAEAEYKTAVKVAEAAEDEPGKMRAQLAFMQREKEIGQRVIAERELKLALDEVKKELPDVPDIVWKNITDPEELRKAAKELTKTMQKSGDWGQPGGTPGAPPRGKPSWRDPELRARVNKGRNDPAAYKEFLHSMVEEKIAPFANRAAQNR